MDTTKEMLINFAKNAEERKDKVYYLFRYFEKINHTKTKQFLIDMISYTDFQIEQEIESWINFEKTYGNN